MRSPHDQADWRPRSAFWAATLSSSFWYGADPARPFPTSGLALLLVGAFVLALRASTRRRMPDEMRGGTRVALALAGLVWWVAFPWPMSAAGPFLLAAALLSLFFLRGPGSTLSATFHLGLLLAFQGTIWWLGERLASTGGEAAWLDPWLAGALQRQGLTPRPDGPLIRAGSWVFPSLASAQLLFFLLYGCGVWYWLAAARADRWPRLLWVLAVLGGAAVARYAVLVLVASQGGDWRAWAAPEWLMLASLGFPWLLPAPRRHVGHLLANSGDRVSWRPALGAVVATMALAVALTWHPSGATHAGRVLLLNSPLPPIEDEESASVESDGLEQVLSHYYELRRLGAAELTAGELSAADVIVLTPARRLSDEEQERLTRRVREGAGLMVFATDAGTASRRVAERLGMRFDDRAPLRSAWRPGGVAGAWPHPLACSMQEATPVWSGVWGEPVVTAEAGSPATRGAVIAGRMAGRGRVMVAGDSRWCRDIRGLMPGNRELLVSLVEWVNRAAPRFDPRWLVLLLGGLGATLVLRGTGADQRLQLGVLLALGLALGAAGARTANAWSLATPAGRDAGRHVAFCRQSTTFHLPDTILSPPPRTLDGPPPRAFRGLFLECSALGLLPGVEESLVASVDERPELIVIADPVYFLGDQSSRELRDYLDSGGRALVLYGKDALPDVLNTLVAELGAVRAVERRTRDSLWRSSDRDPLWLDAPLDVHPLDVRSGEGATPLCAGAQGDIVAAEIAVGAGRLVIAGLADLVADDADELPSTDAVALRRWLLRTALDDAKQD